jgi:hypothetical protein
MDKIKIIKNFLSSETAAFVRDFADATIEHNEHGIVLDQINPESTRPLIRFGRDAIPGSYNENFSVLPDVERLLFEDISARSAEAIKDAFSDPDELYLVNFWVSRQYPGSRIDPHEDTDGGLNNQFVYSAIIYLNTLPDDGHLVFDDLGYSVHPEEGDLVAFLTKETGKHRVPPIKSMRYSIPIWLTKDIQYKLPY